MAATPRSTSGREKVARDEARMRSVFRAASKPPPKQMPLTALIMGFFPVRVDRPAKPEGRDTERGVGEVEEFWRFHSR